MKSTMFAASLMLVTSVLPAGAVAAGVELGQIDRAVRPCDDFYRHANGKWLDANAVPADQARWGSFNQIDERNRKILREILEAARDGDAAAGSVKRKVGDFYASGMSTTEISPAKALDAAFALTKEPLFQKSMAGAFGQMHAQSTPLGFNFAVRQDSRDASRYIVQLFQGGLGLPEREYYLATDEKTRKLREDYLKLIATMLALSGSSSEVAVNDAKAVMDLETVLAKASMPRVEARDPDKTYNLTSLAQLQKDAPYFRWQDFFNAVGVPAPGDINVGQPAFFREFSRLTRETPASTWFAYATWHRLRSLAPYMGGAFEQNDFAFYGKILTGVEAMETRDKRVIAAIDRTMGDALGQLYIEKAFSPRAKEKALALVRNVTAALRTRIESLDWMGAATKKEAIGKLDAINVKIGYPDQWKDYSAVEIKRDDYLGNILRAQQAEFRRQIARLGKPIDRSQWSMTPSQANAYYSSGLNEIVFPAGILQPPFFDENADDASNYGGIGMVIGHELTHGFDDRGRKFDAIGNRRDWWTKEDEARYNAKAEAIAKQYDGYQPIEGMSINGKVTLGENIADFGGLRVAYLGLQLAQKQAGQTARLTNAPPGDALATSSRTPVLDGVTSDQRFFLSYAQSWRQNIREAELRRRLMTDSHSPARYRVLGPLGNLPEFQQAFGCKAGEKMLRAADDQVTVW